LTALVTSGDEHDVAEHFLYSCLLERLLATAIRYKFDLPTYI